MMMTVDVHQKCEHFGLGLGLATAGLDYIPGITLVCSCYFFFFVHLL